MTGYEGFALSVLSEAIQAQGWYKAKVRTAAQPKMSMSLARSLIRDARDFGLISQKEYQKL